MGDDPSLPAFVGAAALLLAVFAAALVGVLSRGGLRGGRLAARARMLGGVACILLGPVAAFVGGVGALVVASGIGIALVASARRATDAAETR